MIILAIYGGEQPVGTPQLRWYVGVPSELKLIEDSKEWKRIFVYRTTVFLEVFNNFI